MIAAAFGTLAEVGVLAAMSGAVMCGTALVDDGLEARHGQRPVLDRQHALDRASAELESY